MNFVKRRKILSGFLAVILIFLVFFAVKGISGNKNGETSYVLAAAEKGTLVDSISGSGQVSASYQLDVKPKVSGDVVNVAAASGQAIKAGGLIMQIDSTDAQKAVRDAAIGLENAQISLDQANTTLQNTTGDLKKAYDQAFNYIDSSFVDFQTALYGLNDAIFSNSLTSSQWNLDIYLSALNQKASDYSNVSAYQSYHASKLKYQANLADYNSISRSADTAKIDSLISETYQTAKSFSMAIKDAASLIQSYKNSLTAQNLPVSSSIDVYLSNLASYSGKINGDVINLYTVGQTIQTKAGADPLNIQSRELSVKQQQNALSDAQQKLANYSVRAPFDGVIAKINFSEGDSVSSGTAVATLITKQLTAEISLNEVDIAKIKTGQSATLTFDAVSGLSITGKVGEVDTIGTVSQGVVTYNVKIIFDTTDIRVKPGMSVSAAIITDIKADALLVPSSAVKNKNGGYYVETLDSKTSNNAQASAGNTITTAAQPKNQSVEIGLSNDSQTEIISGLSEGDKVVSRTITSGGASNQTRTTTQSIIPTGSSNRANSGGMPRN